MGRMRVSASCCISCPIMATLPGYSKSIMVFLELAEGAVDEIAAGRLPSNQCHAVEHGKAARVPQPAFDGILANVAVAPHDLDRVVRHLERHAVGVHLRQVGLF